MELNLRFPSVNQVVVKCDDQETDTLDFVSPLTEADLKEIQWYLETYSADYTSDPDDAQAQRLEANLEKWGVALFEAVFTARAAGRIFNDFQDDDEEPKLLTIAASHPAILSLPWELLRDPEGTYLVHDNPRISVRRKLAGAGGGRRPFRVKPKETIRVLFVTSRPKGAGFIDPRAEAIPVLEAIKKEGEARISVEFLRPATMANLTERLEDKRSPAVDILHFDGHGVYDSVGTLHQKAKQHDPGLKASNVAVKPNMGYLLFEDEAGESALITAETLGDMLNRQQVGLIVLSACQSAKVAGEDAMGSVAARLTHSGIPTVLAMTHSVLVTAATQLFAKFYQRLVRGEGTGEALDNARRDLYLHRERGDRQRLEGRITLKLQDWFLPALYQGGKDTPLLTTNDVALGRDARFVPEEAGNNTNLPEVQEAGFWGRTEELWDIEQAFVRGTQRITLSGFGGQGKTYLAQEAGRWLHRTRMFGRVCFVDFAGFQGTDALSYTVSVLATVLEQNFIDGDAVRKYLWQERVSLLVILDNLEVLAGEALQALLAAAKSWSETGQTKVIVTTRDGNLQAVGYEAAGTRKHLAMPLNGLSSEDAVNYFNALVKLPPEPDVPLPDRNVLIAIFKRVGCHPLSIGLLARQLKTRRYIDVVQRLDELLVNCPENPLLASLQLSLDRLDEKSRALLPKLGVFQGGAFENILLEITEFEEGIWRELRDSLVATGLITLEHLPNIGVPYLKFHPTLAPALWEDSPQSPLSRDELITKHRERYCELSRYLYVEDQKNPLEARAIAMRELPNLLYGVKGALAAETDYAVDFVDKVCLFLNYFGMQGDRQRLTAAAQKLGVVGSEQWYLAQSNHGEQLRSQGKIQEAAAVFSGILAQLGAEPTYRRCITLNRLGRCFKSAGQAAQAAALYRQGIAVGEQLEQDDSVKRQIGALNTDLGDVLADSGDFSGARQAYEKALKLIRAVNDQRSVVAINGQLGTLARLEGNLEEAADSYQAALKIFQSFKEPATEAVIWHQLGMVYQESRQWEAAEQHYRRSVSLSEQQGNFQYAASTWNQLAIVCEGAGKTAEAEDWYRKAIAANRKIGNPQGIATGLNNLANLLQNDPARLPEARQLAEEALTIRKTLDPAASEIWKTYNILAEITEKQGEMEQSQEYRRLARESRAAYAGSQHQIQQLAPFLVMIIQAIDNAEMRQQLQPLISQLGEQMEGLSDAIQQIWNGERDEETLIDPLDAEDSMIIYAILEGINNPDSLQRFID